MPAEHYVRRLSDVDLADGETVGRKAAALGELTSEGFQVPPGFVVSVEALRQVLGDLIGTEKNDVAVRRISETALPSELTTELAEAYRPYADTRVAVRSSGIAEDLAGASFAGQYESVLNVSGWEALIEAVRECWRSALAARISAYHGTKAGPVAATMAVLVQQMVPADAAGVAFSANPVTGNRSEVVINATPGLGEQLVAGSVTPEEWMVSSGVATRSSGPDKVLSEEQALEIAAMARRVADYAGTPQDIEWALASNQLWLLQARPITALPPELGGRSVPDGFWIRDSYSPHPQRLLPRSLVQNRLNEYNRHIFTYSLLDRFEYVEIDGWMYSRVVYLTEPNEINAAIDRIVAAVAADEPGERVRFWREVAQPRLEQSIDRLREVDLSTLSDQQLREHLAAARALADDALEQHFLASGAASFCWGQLGRACEELLGWGPAEVLRLVTGLPSKTTEPTWELSRLVTLAAQCEQTKAMIKEPTSQTRDELASTDPAFSAEFERYLRNYGLRTLSHDITEQTLVEQPNFILAVVHDLLIGNYNPNVTLRTLQQDRDAATAEVRAALAESSPGDRIRVDALIERAQRAYPVRDDSAYYTNVTRVVVRFAALEVASRLVDRGQIPDIDAIFDLTIDDVMDALVDKDDRHAAVAEERQRYAEAQASPGPRILGRPGAPPSWAVSRNWIDELPVQAAATMYVVDWVGRATTPMASSESDATLHGVAASPGRYTGPARVILDESEFGKLRRGDVLVCPETTAQWSMLFPSVGALVTNTGGQLSHPAIIAREYGIPAVVATTTATTTVVDGQLLTVDGTTGEVWVSES
ncbi:MAG: pyruvate, phosphate dikinase [Pseudonocardiales bacterium]|nr:pyruvate, phosphate dikinase [Pseudonocardiales bacterium]